MPAHPIAAMERSARRVRLLRLRTPDTALRLRIQSGLEEALRRTSLPGEDQGRVYFFRRLRLPNLQADQPSLEWIARCSEQLLALSRDAVHIDDPQSGNVDAMYARDSTEPLRLQFSRWIEDRETKEWFWPQATGVATELSREKAVEQLLDRWCCGSAGWAAVARELLPWLRVEQIERALELIRPASARKWLSIMGGARSHPLHAVPLPVLRSASRQKVYRAQLRFGDHGPRVLWLCTLAILEAAPSLPQDALLPELAARVLAQSSPHRVVSSVLNRERPPGQAGAPDARVEHNAQSCLDTHAAKDSENRSDQSSRDPSPHVDLGRVTAFGGLYFLLTPMRLLGIVDAYADSPALAVTHLAERVLLRLARSCGVDEEDPILLPCINSIEYAVWHSDPLVHPSSLVSLRRFRSTAALTERLWAAAVRRWCHRHAKMRLAEIVARPGRLYATATAIDIVLPMSAVDIRIRRCGLDIDPGYQPWFGQVVHFHYRAEVQHEPQP
jgi:hypothetical protein